MSDTPVIGRDVELLLVVAFEGRPLAARRDSGGRTIITVSESDDPGVLGPRVDFHLLAEDIALLRSNMEVYKQRYVRPLLNTLMTTLYPKRLRRVTDAQIELVQIARGRQAADYGP